MLHIWTSRSHRVNLIGKVNPLIRLLVGFPPAQILDDRRQLIQESLPESEEVFFAGGITFDLSSNSRAVFTRGQVLTRHTCSLQSFTHARPKRFASGQSKHSCQDIDDIMRISPKPSFD